MHVDFIRDGLRGHGAERTGNSRWRRMTGERCRAKSVFHFDVQGSVAKSTHAGRSPCRAGHQKGNNRMNTFKDEARALEP